MAPTTSTVTSATNGLNQSNMMKQEIDILAIKREKIATEITAVAKQKLQMRPEIKRTDSLASVDLLPIKTDTEDSDSNDNLYSAKSPPVSPTEGEYRLRYF